MQTMTQPTAAPTSTPDTPNRQIRDYDRQIHVALSIYDYATAAGLIIEGGVRKKMEEERLNHEEPVFWYVFFQKLDDGLFFKTLVPNQLDISVIFLAFRQVNDDMGDKFNRLMVASRLAMHHFHTVNTAKGWEKGDIKLLHLMSDQLAPHLKTFEINAIAMEMSRLPNLPMAVMAKLPPPRTMTKPTMSAAELAKKAAAKRERQLRNSLNGKNFIQSTKKSGEKK